MVSEPRHMEDWRELPPRIILRETDSTNRVAKELARQGAPHGSRVEAERQTAGRGRLDHSFFSPQGGVYLSVILRPDVPREDRALITPMAAVAVRQAVNSITDIELGIKWVNDLYLGDKKVGGILCEAVGDAVIVGVGLNVWEPEGGFPPELNAAALNTKWPPETFSQLIYEKLLQGCQGLSYPGVPEDYVTCNIVLKRDLTVHPIHGAPYPARGKWIDRRGRLIVETAEGEKTLDSGEVSVRF